MTIRTADGDVPPEINPQHGWRAPETLISPPPQKWRGTREKRGTIYSNNLKALKDGEGFLYLIAVEESRRHQKFKIYEGITKETSLNKIPVKLGRLL